MCRTNKSSARESVSEHRDSPSGLRKRWRSWCSAVRHKSGNLFTGLFLSVAFFAILGVIAIPVVWFLLSPAGVAPEQRLNSSLAIIGGLGGVVFLVKLYREQSVAERREGRELEDRLYREYESELQRLTSPNSVERINAVVGLARLCDDNAKLRQKIVDVFCAYLKVPPVMRPRYEFGKTADVRVLSDAEIRAERLVEKEIVDQIRRGMASSPGDGRLQGGSWRGLYLDFQDATFLGELDLHSTHLDGGINLRGVTLCEGARFNDATIVLPFNFLLESSGNADLESGSGGSTSTASNEYVVDFTQVRFDCPTEYSEREVTIRSGVAAAFNFTGVTLGDKIHLHISELATGSRVELTGIVPKDGAQISLEATEIDFEWGNISRESPGLGEKVKIDLSRLVDVRMDSYSRSYGEEDLPNYVKSARGGVKSWDVRLPQEFIDDEVDGGDGDARDSRCATGGSGTGGAVGAGVMDRRVELERQSVKTVHLPSPDSVGQEAREVMAELKWLFMSASNRRHEPPISRNGAVDKLNSVLQGDVLPEFNYQSVTRLMARRLLPDIQVGGHSEVGRQSLNYLCKMIERSKGICESDFFYTAIVGPAPSGQDSPNLPARRPVDDMDLYRTIVEQFSSQDSELHYHRSLSPDDISSRLRRQIEEGSDELGVYHLLPVEGRSSLIVAAYWPVSEESVKKLVEEKGVYLASYGGFILGAARIVAAVPVSYSKRRRWAFVLERFENSAEWCKYVGRYVPTKAGPVGRYGERLSWKDASGE